MFSVYLGESCQFDRPCSRHVLYFLSVVIGLNIPSLVKNKTLSFSFESQSCICLVFGLSVPSTDCFRPCIISGSVPLW